MFAHFGGKWCPFTLNIFSCKQITDELLFFTQNIFYDLVTKVPWDKRFPRANHITVDDLNTLGDSFDDFKALEKRVRYCTHCALTFEFLILFTNILCETFLQAKTLDELYKDYGLGKHSDQLYKDYQTIQVASSEQTGQNEGLEAAKERRRCSI
jgi:hypothetical protein